MVKIEKMQIINTVVGAFVTAAARDLMYSRYLSKLQSNQLLYPDSAIVYIDKRNPLHATLPTSNMLGELRRMRSEQ